MTTASKGLATLLGVTLITTLGIAYIHEGQKLERENLHKGVIRDKELYKMKLEQLGSAKSETSS